jgi:hypothetical protein
MTPEGEARRRANKAKSDAMMADLEARRATDPRADEMLKDFEAHRAKSAEAFANLKWDPEADAKSRAKRRAKRKAKLKPIPGPSRAELQALGAEYRQAGVYLKNAFNSQPAPPEPTSVGVSSDIPTLTTIAGLLEKASAGLRDLDHKLPQELRKLLEPSAPPTVPLPSAAPSAFERREDFELYLDLAWGDDPKNARIVSDFWFSREDLTDIMVDVEGEARRRCRKAIQDTLVEIEETGKGFATWVKQWLEVHHVDPEEWKHHKGSALFNGRIGRSSLLSCLYYYRGLVDSNSNRRENIKKEIKPKTNEKTGELPHAQVFDAAEVPKLPMRQWVLGDRFLASAVTLGYAAPGLAKTLVGSISAIAIASGFSGTGEVVHRTGNALIVNNEETQDELKRRLGAGKQELGVELKHKIQLMSGLDDGAVVLVRKDGSGVIRDTACVQALIDYIKANEIIHVVLDPLVSFHSGINENDNAEMNKVLGTIARIAATTGCSIDCIHHSRKGDRKASSAETIDRDGGRGAFAQLGVARSSYQLVRIGEKSLLRRRIPQELHHHRLIAMVSPKKNYSADSDEIVAAFYLKSVAIPNGPEGTDGDNVGVPIKIDLLSPENVLTHEELVVRVIAEQMPNVAATDGTANPKDGAMRAPAKDFYAAICSAFNVKPRTAERYVKDALGGGRPIEIELANGNRCSVQMESKGKGKTGDIIVTAIKGDERDDDEI